VVAVEQLVSAMRNNPRAKAYQVRQVLTAIERLEEDS